MPPTQQPPAAAVAPVTFTRAGVRYGMVAAQPMAASVLLYGAVFGVLAGENGFDAVQALMMSALVFSGSAQLAALEIGVATPFIAPLLAAVILLNARYLLYGAALRPWLSKTTPLRAYGTLFFNGDGSWALSMRQYAKGYRDAGFVFGSGFAMFLPWCAGTLGGHVLASWVPDPKALGLDFMLVAFAAAIGVGAWRGRADVVVALVAVGVALLAWTWLPSGWHIVGAGLAGAVVGALRHRGG